LQPLAPGESIHSCHGAVVLGDKEALDREGDAREREAGRADEGWDAGPIGLGG
jgi:hypothetical protein